MRFNGSDPQRILLTQCMSNSSYAESDTPCSGDPPEVSVSRTDYCYGFGINLVSGTLRYENI